MRSQFERDIFSYYLFVFVVMLMYCGRYNAHVSRHNNLRLCALINFFNNIHHILDSKCKIKVRRNLLGRILTCFFKIDFFYI